MSKKPDSYKSLFFNTIIFAVGSFSSKILVLILLPVYTYSLTTAEYGIADLVAQIANFLIPVVSLSISDAVIRFNLDSDYSKKEVFSSAVVTVGSGILVFAVLCPLFNLYSRISDYVFILFLYVTFAVIKLLFAEFARSRKLVKLYSLNGLITTVLTLTLNIVFLFVLDLGIKGYLMAIVISDLCSALFLFFIADYKSFFSFRAVRKDVLSNMLRFSLPLMPAALLWIVTNVSDRFFVTEMIGEDANGMLTVAYRLPMIVAALYGMISQAWNMSAIEENSSRNRNRFYTNVFRCNSAIVFVCAGGIMMVLIPLMSIFVSDSFFAAYKYAPMLIVSMIFTCFSSFLGGVYTAVKKTKNSFYTSLCAAVINLLLNWILIPKIGIQGAAIATLVSYAAVFIYRIIDARRFVPFEVDFIGITFNTAIIFAMGVMTIISSGILLAGILISGFVVVFLYNIDTLLKMAKTVLPEKLAARLHLNII